MTEPRPDSVRRILMLNDAFRQTFIGGSVILTAGVAGLSAPLRQSLLDKVRAFSKFTEDNDPHGEHDFGVVEVEDVKCFWKIGYHDLESETLSPDPANPRVTKRVLTIMLADEY